MSVSNTAKIENCSKWQRHKAAEETILFVDRSTFNAFVMARGSASLVLGVIAFITGLIFLWNIFSFHAIIVGCRTSPQASLSNSPFIATSSTKNSVNSKFDEVASITYRRASALANTDRKPFDLDKGSWRRGTGGLDDADRKVLFSLYYKAESVFEWGLGESTLIATKVGVPRYTGVDSDPVWVGETRKKTEDLSPHFRVSYADVGGITHYGRPKKLDLKKIAYNYQVLPLIAEEKPFDVYMADGRYRVACACVAFLHAMKHGGDLEKVRVLVHDNDAGGSKFADGRGYDAVESIADVVVRNKKLWVYKLRKETTEEDVFQLWEKFETEAT